jgi:DNA-directed RNA polymerase specialized sigma24 family protein
MERQDPWHYLTSPVSYSRLRRKLILFLNSRGCREAQQLADEVVMRVVQAVSQGRDIQDIEAFAFGIAKNLFADWVAELQRPIPWSPVHASASSPRARCLEGCLRKLSTSDRELVEAYFVDRQRKSLAAALGVSVNALRIRVCRLKGELRSCTEDCLKADA